MNVSRQRRRAGFSLIEIMVVIGILGIVLAMGAPTFIRARRGEPMRQTVAELVEVFANARARAILQGKPTAVVFQPLERKFAVDGAADSEAGKLPGSGLSGSFAEAVALEMLDVNLVECRLAESARVRFQPNGTADECTIVLHGRSEWTKITLDPVTGFPTVGDVK